MLNTTTVNPLRKWTPIILIDSMILSIIICFFYFVRPFNHSTIKIDGVLIEYPRDIPNLNLIDHHGKLFNKTQLKGHWTFMFFGFTHCPMICPTTLDALNKMYDILKKQLPPNSLPQIIFISIDPERDSIARLNQYVSAYNSHFIGARMDIKQQQNIEKHFFVSVEKINGNITHNSDILLLNPNALEQPMILDRGYLVTNCLMGP